MPRMIVPARTRASIAAVGALLLLAASCKDSTAPPAPAAARIAGGDRQEGLVAASLAQDLTVQVVDEDGRGVPDIHVAWSAPPEAGSVQVSARRTGADGKASARWTLGTRSGEVTVTAVAGDLPPVTFHATARAAWPAALERVGGAYYEAVAGTVLPVPRQVAVADSYGNPVPGARVEWVIIEGGGSAAPGITTTGEDGVASTEWRLGTTVGGQRMRATVQGPTAGGAALTTVFSAGAVAGPAATMEGVAGATQEGTVAAVLEDSLVVEARDQYGNPVPGVAVTWDVLAGGGSVAASTSTDADGRAAAAWTLGTVAGANRVAALGAGHVVEFTAQGRPAAPERLLVEEGASQAGVVGEPLPDPLQVRLEDRFGNAVPGVTVTWSADDGGVFTPAEVATDTAGRAATTWRLGTAAGSRAASATAAGLEAQFAAEGAPGPASVLRPVSGDGQRATVGEALPDPLRVRLEDAYGNPVADAPVSWTVTGGALLAADSGTDAVGEASARWNVGRTAGALEAIASVDTSGASPAGTGSGGVESAGSPGLEARFTAMADPTTLNLTVGNAYLVQSVQRSTGDIPMVAGREALLRVFVLGTEATAYRPDVRVRLFNGGSLLAEEVIAAGAETLIDATLPEEPLGRSYNMRIPGELVQPGLQVEAEVDFDDRIIETREDDNLYPGRGARLQPAVDAVAPFRVTFVPMLAHGRVGDVSDYGIFTLLFYARRLMPLHEVDAALRTTVLDMSHYDLTSSSDWPRILRDLEALRVVEGGSRYYFGVVPSVAGAAWGGMAYVPGRSSIGVENTPVAAHEWGHNWGRWHAPCGNPTGVDASYPYADGSIGVYGYDAFERVLRSPGRYKDLMGYCGPEWISDYTYEGVLAYRTAEAGANLRAGPPSAPEDVLVVWGTVTPDSLVLEPAFRAHAPPSLPGDDGPVRLEGLDRTGAPLFELRFAPLPVADVPDAAAHFAFAVPLDRVRELHRLRLSDGRRSTELRRPLPAAAPGLDARARRLDTDRVRVVWDAGAHPLVVVREADTGAIIRFARGGDVVVRTSVAELDLVPSDGLGGDPVRVRPR